MGEYTCAGNLRTESVPGRVWQPNISTRPAYDSDPGAVARSLWLRVATLMNDGRTRPNRHVGACSRSQVIIVRPPDQGLGIYVHNRWQKVVTKEFMAAADGADAQRQRQSDSRREPWVPIPPPSGVTPVLHALR